MCSVMEFKPINAKYWKLDDMNMIHWQPLIYNWHKTKCIHTWHISYVHCPTITSSWSDSCKKIFQWHKTIIHIFTHQEPWVNSKLLEKSSVTHTELTAANTTRYEIAHCSFITAKQKPTTRNSGYFWQLYHR